jgi:putative oxidoreductase
MNHLAGRRSVLAAAVLHTCSTGARSRWIAAVRWIAAIIFISFGITKFADYAAEVASFRHYPVPAPGSLVYLVGVAETGGGLLLGLGLLTRLAALALAGDMIGAIAVSGVARGELISLTLAPLLLVTMLLLTWSGGGRWSTDSRLASAVSRHGHEAGHGWHGADHDALHLVRRQAARMQAV